MHQGISFAMLLMSIATLFLGIYLQSLGSMGYHSKKNSKRTSETVSEVLLICVDIFVESVYSICLADSEGMVSITVVPSPSMLLMVKLAFLPK